MIIITRARQIRVLFGFILDCKLFTTKLQVIVRIHLQSMNLLTWLLTFSHLKVFKGYSWSVFIVVLTRSVTRFSSEDRPDKDVTIQDNIRQHPDLPSSVFTQVFQQTLTLQQASFLFPVVCLSFTTVLSSLRYKPAF